VCLGRARDLQRDVLDAVAVARGEARDLVVLPQRARQDEADVTLLDDVRRAVAHARLGAGVRGAAEAEGVLAVGRGLLCVPDPQLDVVPPVERHEVRRHGTRVYSTCSGTRSRRQASATPSPIARPPAIWTSVRLSDRRTTAKSTPTNGWKFAN